MRNNARELRAMLASGKTVVVPSADDPLTATMVKKLGFDGVYLGSYSGSARTIGVVDSGLISQTEMTSRIQYVSAANPEQIVFADGESGFGNPLNVARTVRMYEAAGAAAMQLNDTAQIDDRCPYIGLPEIPPVSIEEMQARIQTAQSAKTNPDFFIYCPASGATMEERVERSYAYLEAGADSVFLGWKDYRELEAFASAMSMTSKPLKVSTYPFATHHPSVQDLTDMGYKIIFFVLHTLYAAAGAEWRALRELKETGNVSESSRQFVGHDQLLELLGIDEVKAQGLEYERRLKSVGSEGI